MNTNIYKLFKQFLIENGVFYQFFIYSLRREKTRKALLSRLKGTDPGNWIISSFDWTRTIEGVNFWNRADIQWTNIVKQYIHVNYV